MLRLIPAFRMALAITITCAACHPAQAAQRYDKIVVFGDSYSDVGNIYIATKGAIPLSPPYYQGRFSNGPVWVEHLAQSFGLPLKPYLAGGTDYAFGGAELLQDLATPEGTVPGVASQVGLYLAAHGGKADPERSMSSKAAATIFSMRPQGRLTGWDRRSATKLPRLRLFSGWPAPGTSWCPICSTWDCFLPGRQILPSTRKR